MKKTLPTFLLIIFTFAIFLKNVAIANEIPKGTKAFVQIESSYRGKQLNSGDTLIARLINDVSIDEKTVIKSGAKAYIIVNRARDAQFAGGCGIIELENGFIYSNGNRYMFDFAETIKGKQKNWVRVVMFGGIILIPLLCVGFVKGGQAKIHENRLYEIEFNGKSYNF